MLRNDKRIKLTVTERFHHKNFERTCRSSALGNTSRSWTGDASDDNGTPMKPRPTPELKRRLVDRDDHRATCRLPS
ncbi:hypothetical protein FA95DRAFT_1606929 [Auriscalpium vulgare]|uniref:Uncharacterized protein n=1 Tax=Auriscalpium vulgare TaxID=40419 RepID=A0ACB8RQY0_9AGAM|nr:hypothetical protein FA95DRAFT_1606929 [Auriscalpium vulgare]